MVKQTPMTKVELVMKDGQIGYRRLTPIPTTDKGRLPLPSWGRDGVGGFANRRPPSFPTKQRGAFDPKSARRRQPVAARSASITF